VTDPHAVIDYRRLIRRDASCSLLIWGAITRSSPVDERIRGMLIRVLLQDKKSVRHDFEQFGSACV
jgi:hypothetical protein